MTVLDAISLIWFFTLWAGYTLFAKRRAKTSICLASELRVKRFEWMQHMLQRDNRIADISIISTLERNISFFASSSILILAGLITAVSSSDKLSDVLHQIIPTLPHMGVSIQLKILLLIFIYVFAFFQFTWSLRQYGFAGVLIGAAPDGRKMEKADIEKYAGRASKVVDQAAHSFNYGLRAIYFSMGSLTWFLDSRLFMLTTVAVVLVLYQREFYSKAFDALRHCYTQSD